MILCSAEDFGEVEAEDSEEGLEEREQEVRANAFVRIADTKQSILGESLVQPKFVLSAEPE